MTNCGLLAGPDVVVPASIVSGNVDWLMAIPNVASLVGFQFFAQAFVFDGGANTFGATLSNGLAATVGDA